MSIPSIGEFAPQFDLPRDGGGAIALKNFLGKKVVLFFYPKDATSGCTAESIDFSALAQQFEHANTVVIGMSPDSVKSHDKFAAKHALTVMLASDEEKTTLAAYGVWVQKSMYGRKYMGVERTTILIDTEGKVAAIWPKVKVAGHAAEVLETARTI
jgi:peroxiredoxin Q/BCP